MLRACTNTAGCVKFSLFRLLPGASDWQYEISRFGMMYEIGCSCDRPNLFATEKCPGSGLQATCPPYPGSARKMEARAAIVPYSRKFPEQDRAIETVFRLMRQHPEGVTVNELNELMQAHNDKLQGEIAWFNSIDVLIDEGRVYTCPKWRERGYLESLKLFAK
jgi:hypothetical protein